jgi:hypothetical protein
VSIFDYVNRRLANWRPTVSSSILLPGQPDNVSGPIVPKVVNQAQQFSDTFQRMYEFGDAQGHDPTRFLRAAYPYDVYTLLDPEHGDGLQLVFADRSRVLMYSNERDKFYVMTPEQFYQPPKIGNRYKGIDNV